MHKQVLLIGPSSNEKLQCIRVVLRRLSHHGQIGSIDIQRVISDVSVNVHLYSASFTSYFEENMQL